MLFPNISSFDFFEVAPTVSGQDSVGGGESPLSLTVWLAGVGLPALVLVVLVLVLVLQNLDRVLALCDRFTQLWDRFMALVDRIRHWRTNPAEAPPAAPQMVVIELPRNLSDSERIALGPCAPGTQWV